MGTNDIKYCIVAKINNILWYCIGIVLVIASGISPTLGHHLAVRGSAVVPRIWVLLSVFWFSSSYLSCLLFLTYETGTNPALLALPALPGCPPHPMASVDVRSGS